MITTLRMEVMALLGSNGAIEAQKSKRLPVVNACLTDDATLAQHENSLSVSCSHCIAKQVRGAATRKGDANFGLLIWMASFEVQDG